MSCRCYKYDSVYPSAEKELQLEQVRALLPQYAYKPAETKPVVHYQKDKVYPAADKELQLEQVRALLPKYEISYDMEMTEVCTTAYWPAPHLDLKNIPQANRDPLCVSVDMDEESCDCGPLEQYSVDDQLELMCANKSLPIIPSANTSDGEDDFEIEVRKLENYEPTSLLEDKENRDCGSCRKGCYVFTPNTVEDSLNYPCTNRTGDCINTKLNFTDTDSILSVSNHSHAEDVKQQQHSSIGGSFSRFGITSDLEKKAKLLRCQQGWKEEFAATEVDMGKMHLESKPTTECDGSQTRKPLQPLILQKASVCNYSANQSNATCDESSFIPYHDSSTSTSQPAQHQQLQPSQASFSVYDDSNNESSFMPYHDSMHVSSSFRNAPAVLQDKAPKVYSASLGVPLLHSEQSISEQTFTQFDIGHPNEFEPVSTPKFVHHQNVKDLTLDLSVIPAPDYKVSASHTAQLSPIKEESSKSTSSSRFTVSSSSSGNSCSSVSSTIDHVNPFLPDMMNRMLNSVGGVPQHCVQAIPVPLSPATDKHVHLGGRNWNIVDKGGFSQIYKVQCDAEIQALQIRKCSIEWEITVISQLQQRLQKNGLQQFCNYFQQYYQVYQCPTSFYTLSMYHPLGSIQDLVMRLSDKKMVITEPLAAYLSLEMLCVVGCLHQCGIIHAAIKPSHFLLHDIRDLLVAGGGARPGGLRLVDMRHAIDARQFPDDQLFVGDVPYLSCNNIVVEGQSWKWQVDYCGLALCLLSLITQGRPPMVTRKEGLYTWANKPYKKFNSWVWQELIETLLNTVDVLPQDQQSLQEKAKCLQLKDIKYCLQP